ncbi:MAG: hypothetical protein RQ847_02155 [Wenzhouxiangellaceae bacterium]|nr:hypothetical protein [Wenzhouxiangellaceae bacterium]
MRRGARILIRAGVWAALAVLVAAFASGPEFRLLPDGHGQLTLAIARLTDRVRPCRQLTEAERQALPPTRRVREVCERERRALFARLALDGRVLFERRLAPSGLHDDGRVYRIERWPLPAGEYVAELVLDAVAGEDRVENGTPVSRTLAFRLEPGRSAVIDVGDHEVELLNVADETRPAADPAGRPRRQGADET